MAEGLLVGDRVAPFGPFGRRQRQGVVEHGVQHVDERHFRDDAGEELAGPVGDRAHQHAAGAAAVADDAPGRGVALARSARGRPRRNRRRCWSSSRACRRGTSPSPCPSRRGYGRWRRRSRGRPATGGWPRTRPASPCRRSRSRRAAAARCRRARRPRRCRIETGTCGAVVARRHDARRDVVGGIVAGRDLLALAQGALPARHVVVVDLGRRRHRRVGEAQRRGVELVAVDDVERVGRLVEGDDVLGSRRRGRGSRSRPARSRAPAAPDGRHRAPRR